MEKSVIDLLAEHGVEASARRDAPGVYVAGHKIASLGLRVRRGHTYHGLALNVSNDLMPFDRINPCGFAGLSVTRTMDVGIAADIDELGAQLSQRLAERLGYQAVSDDAGPEGG
jgi:lipoyl(octanoyl) transferase